MTSKQKFNKVFLVLIPVGLFFVGYLLISNNSHNSSSIVQLISGSSAKIQFKNEKYDFGTIPDGSSVIYYFRFRNSGKSPLLIYSVTSTCGCTIPKWPKKPILPGRSDSIAVLFKSHGSLGYTDKIITVKSNAISAEKKLLFQGSVIRVYNRNNKVKI